VARGLALLCKATALHLQVIDVGKPIEIFTEVQSNAAGVAVNKRQSLALTIY
jgi:hypothetical protein